MRKVDIVPFEVGHAEAINKCEVDPGNIKIGGKTWHDLMENNMRDSPSWTGICEGEILGCGGIRMFWPGVGEAWALYSAEHIHRYIRECLFWTADVLNEAVVLYNLHRLQATARVDFHGALSWLRHLNFTVEGRLHKYNPDGTDSFIYSRIEV